MANWTIVYPEHDGSESRSRTLDSKEQALSLARDQHRQHVAFDRIEGPDGEVVHREAILEWIRHNPTTS